MFPKKSSPRILGLLNLRLTISRARNFTSSQAVRALRSQLPHRAIKIDLIVILAPPADDAQPPSDPQGTPPEPYSYAFSQEPVTQLAGGTVKIADSTKFKVAQTIAVAEVTIEPGAMRELHVSTQCQCRL